VTPPLYLPQPQLPPPPLRYQEQQEPAKK